MPTHNINTIDKLEQARNRETFPFGYNGSAFNAIDVDDNGAQKVRITDSTGKEMTLEPSGGLPVYIQDQHTTLVSFFFRQVLNTVTVASNTTIDTYTVTLAAGHNVVVGDVLVLKEGVHFFQAEVITVVTNTITLDRPLDFAFTTAAIGQRCTINMNVNGSVTPQIFFITPAGLSIDVDINAIHMHIEDNVAMDTSTFGGLAALTRGVLLRYTNGSMKNLFNIKDNGEFGHHCTLVQYDDRAPAGIYGLRVVKTFNSQSYNGVTIRLSGPSNDQLQIIIQDDLTGLMEFHAIIQGHVVQS